MDQSSNNQPQADKPNAKETHRTPQRTASQPAEIIKTFGVPLAIVVAGAIIAGAILWAASQKSPSAQAPSDTPPLAEDGSRKPVPPVSDDDHIRGNPQAPVVMIEYSDYECPFCQRFHDTMKSIMDTYGKRGEVAWVYRHFPLASIHPKAVTSARAAECVAELGGNEAFWRFTDIYFDNTPANNRVDLSLLPKWAEEAGVDRAGFERCLNGEENKYGDKLTRHTEEAINAGARGTPFTVITTREPLNEEARSLLNAINQQAGQEVFLLIDDNQVGVGGALPKEMLEPVLQTILGAAS
ncbi:MAG: hypothetical protein KatS3mg099_121 [Candidatus Parcubacteria bacterium]|nr:MAG: hypothetical protein KatS3mg099_121 [Candidatus Parcubacteria bacterium]